MKHQILFLTILVFSTYVYADDNGHWKGEFTGTEDFSVTCSNTSWNKTETCKWNANHKEVNGNTYKGSIKTGGCYFQFGT